MYRARSPMQFSRAWINALLYGTEDSSAHLWLLIRNLTRENDVLLGYTFDGLEAKQASDVWTWTKHASGDRGQRHQIL